MHLPAKPLPLSLLCLNDTHDERLGRFSLSRRLIACLSRDLRSKLSPASDLKRFAQQVELMRQITLAALLFFQLPTHGKEPLLCIQDSRVRFSDILSRDRVQRRLNLPQFVGHLCIALGEPLHL
jgi:hypothetical protein